MYVYVCCVKIDHDPEVEATLTFGPMVYGFGIDMCTRFGSKVYGLAITYDVWLERACHHALSNQGANLAATLR